jgi:hypothetical protein
MSEETEYEKEMIEEARKRHADWKPQIVWPEGKSSPAVEM